MWSILYLSLFSCFIILALAYYPTAPITTPTTAENKINTIGCSFFVGFTQLVKTSRTAASTMPGQLNNALPSAIEKTFQKLPSGFWMEMCRSTSSTTVTQAAPIRPVDAGLRP